MTPCSNQYPVENREIGTRIAVFFGKWAKNSHATISFFFTKVHAWYVFFARFGL